MNVSAKEESNRRYSYIPKIWRYVVRSPEINLVDAISSYAPKTQESMFFETHKNKIDEIRRLHESGISQTAIGKQFSISQTSVGRLLRGKR